MSRRFAFESRVRVAAPAPAVFAVLADVESYPRWWAQVRSVEAAGPGAAFVVVRSAAPYELRLVLAREILDREAGVLRSRIDGDLDGWASFELRTMSGATWVRYTQEVGLQAPRLARLPAWADPLLRGNHAWMMRGFGRGLRARLAG